VERAPHGMSVSALKERGIPFSLLFRALAGALCKVLAPSNAPRYNILILVSFKVGLLSRDNMEQVPFAYRLYKCKDSILQAALFKQIFSQNVQIEFFGVWYLSIPNPVNHLVDSGMNDRDTVASVGLVLSRSLPLTYSNKAIKTFRQALSLDEVCIFRVPLFIVFSHLLSAPN